MASNQDITPKGLISFVESEWKIPDFYGTINSVVNSILILLLHLPLIGLASCSCFLALSCCLALFSLSRSFFPLSSCSLCSPLLLQQAGICTVACGPLQFELDVLNSGSRIPSVDDFQEGNERLHIL